MLRYLFLIPCLVLAFLTVQTHKESESLSVAMANPANDPAFASIAGLNTYEQFTSNPDLASNYNQAWQAYRSQENITSQRKNDLTELRDKYVLFCILSILIFSLSFFPWLSFSRELTEGSEKTIRAAGRTTDKLLSKINAKSGTIIRREGLRTYSASTELKNWQELREAGVVTDDEFEMAKSEILGKMER